MADELIDRHRAEIHAAIMELYSKYDTTMVFMGLLTHAAMGAERLISAKVVTSANVAEMFDTAKVDALTPDDKPVAVKYLDGDEPVGRKH